LVKDFKYIAPSGYRGRDQAVNGIAGRLGIAIYRVFEIEMLDDLFNGLRQ
jgi:hypothetical protein